jgi:hypothetical protein
MRFDGLTISLPAMRFPDVDNNPEETSRDGSAVHCGRQSVKICPD